MKMYNNGPRRGMMYGGNVRKPMMAEGGKARKVGKEGPMKSKRKKRKDFAALAPPYDEATQADFIAGATGIVLDSKGNPVLDSKGNPVRSN